MNQKYPRRHHFHFDDRQDWWYKPLATLCLILYVLSFIITP